VTWKQWQIIPLPDGGRMFFGEALDGSMWKIRLEEPGAAWRPVELPPLPVAVADALPLPIAAPEPVTIASTSGTDASHAIGEGEGREDRKRASSPAQQRYGKRRR
jgi:hypothetical protein